MANPMDQRSAIAISHQPSPIASNTFAAIVESMVDSGLSVRFRACGDSMSPTILNGDIITVAPVALDDVATGDILLYRDGDRVLAHRLVGLTAPGHECQFRLRGDANIRCDRPVVTAQIVGRVAAIERGGRTVAMRATVAGIRRTSVIMRRYLLPFLCRRLLA
jgi:signal peptidase I